MEANAQFTLNQIPINMKPNGNYKQVHFFIRKIKIATKRLAEREFGGTSHEPETKNRYCAEERWLKRRNMVQNAYCKMFHHQMRYH